MMNKLFIVISCYDREDTDSVEENFYLAKSPQEAFEDWVDDEVNSKNYTDDIEGGTDDWTDDEIRKYVRDICLEEFMRIHEYDLTTNRVSTYENSASDELKLLKV